MSTHSKQHINIFIAYAREDEKILEQLRKQLSVLENKKLVKVWYDGKIQAGENWDSKIKQKLEDADIVVLLISSDFMSSEYARGIEMEKALEKHEARTAQVFPVIVRDCLWEESEIATIQVLPKDGKPVDSRYWRGWDAPLKQVVKSVSKAAQETKASRVANEEWIDKGTRSVNKKVLYVAFVKKANELYAREQWQKAVEKYGQALHYYQEDSEPPKSFLQSRIQRSNIEMGFAEKVRLGKMALKAEEWSDALYVLKEALHLKPNDGELKVLKQQAENQIVLQEKSEKYIAFVEKANEFYLEKEWGKAVETYGEALHYYDEGHDIPKSYLQNRIEQSNIEISLAEKMRLGKAALKAEEWSDALNAFNEALSLKPKDSVLKTLQRQAKKQIAIAEQSQKYVTFVEKANEFYGEGQWQKAAEKYEQALDYYQEGSQPSKSFVQNRIQESTNSGNREVLYVAFVKKANEFYKKEQWKKADEEYERALYYHQGGNEPPKNFLQNRMQQCRIEMGFAEKMRLGKAALKAEEWSDALYVFNKALSLKPNDSVLKVLKQQAEKQIAIAEQSQKYVTFVEKANEFYGEGQWQKAVETYGQALYYYQEDSHPSKSFVQNRIQASTNSGNREVLYVAFVKKANEFYKKEQWKKAAEEYELALYYHQGDNEPPKNFLQNRMQQCRIEMGFAEKMRLGKAALKAEEWSDALYVFNKALSLKPNDSVLKVLKQQAEKQIAIAEQSQKYVTFVEKANEFYGEGQWQKAVETYGQALYYYQEDSHPSKSFVQNRIQVSTNSSNREVLYVAFVKKANEFYKKEQWKKAAEEYELALYYHQGDNEPPKNFLQNRIEECRLLLDLFGPIISE